MTASEIFDVCFARYQSLRDWLADSTGAVRSVDYDTPLEGYQWRPDRARACEYMADFERIGRRALRRPQWKGRLRLFNAYFVRGADYRRAVGLVGVADCTFDYWYREVKRTVGGEFARAGLFPPSCYFESRMARPQKTWDSGGMRRSRRAAPAANKKLPQQGNAEIERHQQNILHEA